jgi:hypothetical protein
LILLYSVVEWEIARRGSADVRTAIHLDEQGRKVDTFFAGKNRGGT